MSNLPVTLPFPSQSGGKTQPLSIPWSSNTTLNKATLNVRATSDRVSMALDIYLNEQMIGALGWTSFDNPGSEKSVSIDVTGLLANGNNNFRVDYYNTFGVNFGTSAHIWEDLLLDFTGDDIIVPPPNPPFDPTLLIYGGAVVIGGFVVYKYLLPYLKK
jgi:hypothetical protein